MAPILSANDVHKNYGKQTALAGVSFDVQPGELFGLLGPNGAGKTTLLGILSGLSDPDRGEVLMLGSKLRSSDRRLRHRIGLATQDLALYPDLTARENLSFFGKLYGLAGTELARRIDAMLESVGLTDRADHRAGTFSGGMKRRLNLALAVIHSPEILLLDEPTTGVDPQSRNHIFERVKALNATGMTILYTSHYMEEVQTLCTRIAILDSGQVKACDTLPNLLHRLESIAHVAIPGMRAELPALIANIPGVKNCTQTNAGLDVTATDLAPVLPRMFTTCAGAGAEIAGLTVHPPTLERVFLHLTGRVLRD